MAAVSERKKQQTYLEFGEEKDDLRFIGKPAIGPPEKSTLLERLNVFIPEIAKANERLKEEPRTVEAKSTDTRYIEMRIGKIKRPKKNKK